MKLRDICLLVLLNSCVVSPPLKPIYSSEYQLLIEKGTAQLLLYDKGQKNALDTATAYYELAIDLAPTFPGAYDGLGSVHFRKHNIHGAESYFKRAIDMDNTYSRSYANLAYVYLLKGKGEEAEQLLRKSISLNKKDFLPYNNLGALLFNRDNKNRQEAKMLIIKAREMMPPDNKIIIDNLKIMELDQTK